MRNILLLHFLFFINFLFSQEKNVAFERDTIFFSFPDILVKRDTVLEIQKPIIAEYDKNLFDNLLSMLHKKKDILNFYLEDVIFEEVVKEEILIEIVFYKDKHYSIDILKPSRYDYINHYVKGKLHKIINRVNNNTKYKQIYSRIFFDIEVPIKKKNIYPNYSDSSSMGTKIKRKN